MDIQSPRQRISMSIVSATSLSTTLYLEGYRIASLDWASGATANAPLTFSVSQDGSSFYDLFDDAGNEVTIASGAFSTAAARAITARPETAVLLSAHSYVRFRRGPSSAPVSTSAAYPFDVVLLPV